MALRQVIVSHDVVGSNIEVLSVHQTAADRNACKISPHTEGMEAESVSAWLLRLALERYAQVFAENDIDIDALRLLGEADLERLGVSLGHRKRLLRALAEVTGEIAPVPGPT